ncbi:MAG: ABC transporter ATP-binding protein [Rhodospirillaceae bacterium]|jgi:branched-chain amino acid transport system ATP-binding protein|nr:ABC transporter ATP-binding protein [Rhodospirillaceae bacterium]MBT4219793.1 ABC transporter ATP-binding protein [Rhodospirillaceae bacterium]MBT4463861.1 ABC transporter ATP-binding protein [Rhodospirillaceae bacterium]MBT5014605.1 ABC transporter ATP-binding protein [Rhodospirillaceae bacterium]MBT5308626.1 ABC transporter ATP-binding protein [Rhodospirillaceae bacterium]
MSDIVLHTQALTRHFGALAAVDDVSLEFRHGETHAVIGPNGAGKTSLINLLSGDLTSDSGSIHFNDLDITGHTPERIAGLGIARSYQKTSILSDFTCLNNCWLGANAPRSGTMRFLRPARADRQANEAAEQALEMCGLLKKRDWLASDLTHGEAHRLEIAMILAANPRVLLLDEPLAGMGADETLRMIALLEQLGREHTMILIEHDMNAVFKLADTITVMVDGKVLETAAPEDIKDSDAVRQAYLGGGE